MNMRPLRMIQVGLGEWGRNWNANVLPQVPSAKTIAWAEPSAAIRRQFSNGPCFVSLEEALAKADAQAVLITSSIASHIPLTLAALAAGKHVLVEKPFASNIREAKKAVDLAAARRLVLMVSQNYRRFPAPEAVADLVRHGELGKLESISVRFAAHMTYDDPGAAHYMLEEPLLEAVSIHHLDLMRFVSGQDAVEIFCQPSLPRGSPYRRPPSAVISARLSGGASVRYDGTVFSGGEKTPLSGHWTMNFANGYCIWTSSGERDPLLSDERMTIHRTHGETDEISLARPSLYGRVALLTDFIRIVRGETPPRNCSLGADNLQTLAMLEAAIVSARERRNVALWELLR